MKVILDFHCMQRSLFFSSFYASSQLKSARGVVDIYASSQLTFNHIFVFHV